MKFTEREMTVGIDRVAQQLFEATLAPWRKAKDTAWELLPKFEKYQRRAAVGEAVIPALLALPERPTVGATPEFTKDEYAAAAGSKPAAKLTKLVVEAMPVRRDPDALLGGDDFVVPDTLEGLD
ncbi:hypothetical protein GCM10011584_16730 [Nocardioides phosphati]|uniref:Uncharacterized protein n=1 Tax=Nocardioides phosphati TaxID=1867775 RepID=A0ABQ2NEA0_9ACTN|nr:hypothetical protein [Nocardioides phosphati]GGO88818.1 hypothetical protein GCM10011584_16730 [Nocardioides phosphati]